MKRITDSLRGDCGHDHPEVKKTALLLTLILCLSSCGKPALEYRTEAVWPRVPEVQVVLLKDVDSVRLAVHAPYRLVNVSNGKTLLWGDELGETTVAFRGGELMLGKDRFPATRVKIISRRDGAVELNGTRYRGEVSLVAVPSNRLNAVNRLNVEEYVQGVLGSEMPSYWDEEALMAQAICIRTYVLQKKLKHKSLNAMDLAYRGTANENWRLNKIVVKTRGIVMFYSGRLFYAYFHSTCGGHTEPATYVFGGKDLGALKGVECGFCGGSRYYGWEVDVSKAEIEEKLRKKYPAIKGLSAVVPVKPGPGGHYSAVKIKYAGGGLEMSANEFRLLVGPSKIFSTALSAKDRGGRIRFKGSGWGHGVGMCQYGAQGMAESGYQWYQILRHYYPGVEFVKVYE